MIVGEKNVANGNIEIKERRTGNREVVEIGKAGSSIEKYLKL